MKRIFTLIGFSFFAGCADSSPTYSDTATLPVQQQNTCSKRFVSASLLNVRDKPDGLKIGKLSKYYEVCAIGTNGEWSEIHFGSDTGWVASKFLKFSFESVSRRQIRVASDYRASYWLDDLSGTKPVAIITTARKGPSGVSFAKREVNCATGQFRYIGDNDDYAKLTENYNVGNFGPLITGSISHEISVFACREQFGMRVKAL